MITELFLFAGAVSVTALAINFAGPVSSAVLAWSRINPALARCAAFWLLFVGGLLLVRIVIRRLSGLLQAERAHWILQGIGLVLGGVRGLWWAGLFAVALGTSGSVYLEASVGTASVIGSRLAPMAAPLMASVASVFPGAREPDARLPLIPPLFIAE